MLMPTTAGAVGGSVVWILRAEGVAVVSVSVWLFASLGVAWWVFVAAFLVPDLAALGFMVSPRVGAMTYNWAHTTIGPLGLGLFAFAAHLPGLLAASIIWLGHIGFDRALGYGLRYPSMPELTHLGAKGGRS